MKTEYHKMLSGELYDSSDDVLMRMRIHTRSLLMEYNQTAYDKLERSSLLKNILGRAGSSIDIQTPFFCDYGSHIEIGDNFYANLNCVILDCNFVRIGNNVMFGPGVHVYTAHHPVLAAERIKGPEYATAIVISDNVWIGGNVVICPGITIGENTTIGAGSVVTKNIPANVLAAGNPCKVIKQL